MKRPQVFPGAVSLPGRLGAVPHISLLHSPQTEQIERSPLGVAKRNPFATDSRTERRAKSWSATQEPGWRLSVSDNGSGPQDASGQAVHIGLGTSIVEALAHQLNATAQKTSGPQGNTVTRYPPTGCELCRCCHSRADRGGSGQSCIRPCIITYSRQLYRPFVSAALEGVRQTFRRIRASAAGALVFAGTAGPLVDVFLEMRTLLPALL